MARESKNGGSVKSNAAAIQSSGRRGMLVSLLIGLLSYSCSYSIGRNRLKARRQE